MNRDNKLENADNLLSEVMSQPHGEEVFLLANVIYLLRDASENLTKKELLLLAERTLDASQLSLVPLLTAERVDAVRTLLENGISPNRFPELPAVSPEDMTRVLLSCDMDVFTDLIEAVALDNQRYYAPDSPVSIIDPLQKLGFSSQSQVFSKTEKSSLSEQMQAAASRVVESRLFASKINVSTPAR